MNDVSTKHKQRITSKNNNNDWFTVLDTAQSTANTTRSKTIKKSISILTFHLQQLTKISFSWEEPQRIFIVWTQPGQEKIIKSETHT